MNKTGLAALVTLLGAGLITTKNFKSSYASETFMAQGKRPVALREKRINQSDLINANLNQWHTKINELSKGKVAEKIPNIKLQRVFYQPPYSHMAYSIDGEDYIETLYNLNSAYSGAFTKKYKNQITIARKILVKATENANDSLLQIIRDNGGSITQTELLNTNEGNKALEDYKEAVLRMKQILPKFRLESYRFTLHRISETTTAKYILETITGRNYGTVSLFTLQSSLTDMKEKGDSFISAPPILDEGQYGSKIVTLDLDKKELTYLKNYMVENNYVTLYASILGYNQFLKANTQIKSIAQDKNYYEKYYPVVFGNPKEVGKVRAPKGATTTAIVWDTDLLSQFNQAEFEDLMEDSIEKLELKYKDILKENVRVDGKRGRIEKRIESEQKEKVKKALEELFSKYGPNIDANEKNELIGTYLKEIMKLPNNSGNQVRNYTITDFPKVQIRNGEPVMEKSTIFMHQIIDYFNKFGIEISVPASLKADAKKRFEETMTVRIDKYRRDAIMAQDNKSNAEKKLQEGLKRF